MVSLHEIARALGGEICGRQVTAPGPHHSPRDRSLSVTIGAGGLLVNSFAGDDWRECSEYVFGRLGLPADAWKKRPREPRKKGSQTKPDDAEERTRRALEIWATAEDPICTPAQMYILRERGLTFPIDIANEVFRFHPAAPWRDESTGDVIRVPAMISLFRNIITDAPQAIQITRLSSSGTKIARRTRGPCGNCAIKLDADENVILGLHIAEGFESALSARQMGFRPVWALGSSGAIGRFPVLPGIEALTILAEAGDTSAKDTRKCFDVWRAAGRDVRVIRSAYGSDMNDALRGAA